MRCSGSARTVIAAIAIAASPAAAQLACGTDAPPMAATNEVWKDGSIIATGNVSIGSAEPTPA